MVNAEQGEDVLGFWFPSWSIAGRAAVTQQAEWWFRGGADAEILARFRQQLEGAVRGGLDHWARTPRSRLALIIVLDQFSRTVYRGTPQAFAQDGKALALTSEGIENGHYAQLTTPWEKAFFMLPLGHSEDLANLERAVHLADQLTEQAPQEVRWWFEFSASQARGHRDVIGRFGRHPHRNQVLGRKSTPAELEYIATGNFVHTRQLPR
ncbi:MAG: DUF924 family protein [Betaproteobacteria bacterium]